MFNKVKIITLSTLFPMLDNLNSHFNGGSLVLGLSSYLHEPQYQKLLQAFKINSKRKHLASVTRAESNSLLKRDAMQR